MGCCAGICGNGKSELEDMEDGNQPDSNAFGHGYAKSWHDNLTLEQKKKIAKDHKAGACFFCKCCGIFGAWSGLKCCCCSFNSETPFLSIKEDRHCTDIPCCLLFIVTILLQIALFLYSVTTLEADPRWLVYYADLYGQLCAPTYDNFEFVFNVTTGGNYAAWPDIRIYDVRICVEHCNDTMTDERIVTPSFDADISDIQIDPATGLAFDISGYGSINILDAVCIPNPDYAKDIASAVIDRDYDEFEAEFDQLSDKVALAVNDVQTATMLFVITAITALLVSMLWGLCIRRLGTLIIWISIAFTLLGMALIAYFLIEYSQYAYLFGYTTIGDIMYYSGYILGVIDGMFALAVCFMYNRIRLAIALAKETTRALTTLWTLFFYPLVPFLTFAVYLIYWIIGGIHMSSVTVEKEWPIPEGYKIPYYVGGPTLQSKLNLPDTDAVYIYLEVDENWQYICLAHFFILLWVTCFISYHTYMVIAGVYAEWYFADWKDAKETKKWRGSDEEVLVINDKAMRSEEDLDEIKAKKKQLVDAGIEMNPNLENEELKTIAKLSRFPVCASFKRVTWYHLGTIAFGSLLIAIIEFIEYTLTYFEKKFINAEPSPIQKLILNLIKCVLRCIKCILNRINRNGLIITSIYGWPFCAASMKGIEIILKNVVRASALSMVSGYLEKLGKICILSLNTGLAIGFAKYYYGDELSSILLPAVICFGITYVVCWQYMHLYEVGISAIFICFLIDEERNKSLQEMKASKRLRKIIGAHKPPKEYLIAAAKSTRNDGLMDEKQKKHFGAEDKLDARDLRTMNSIGNFTYIIGLKEELSVSISVDEMQQTQEQADKADTMSAMQVEMGIKQRM